MPAAKKGTENYLAQFETFACNGARDNGLGTLRSEAMARFAALGFPTTRDEEWRFTSVAPIASRSFSRAETNGNSDDAASHPLMGLVPDKVVFINGRFVSALSSVGTLP